MSSIRVFEGLANKAARFTSTSFALVLVFILIGGWIVSGFFLDFSDSWQLIMNTTSSVITLMMVFMLQRVQHKDVLTIQIKLNEVIAALGGANNTLISIENLSETDITKLQERYRQVAELVSQNEDGPSVDTIKAHEIIKDL